MVSESPWDKARQGGVNQTDANGGVLGRGCAPRDKRLVLLLSGKHQKAAAPLAPRLSKVKRKSESSIQHAVLVLGEKLAVAVLGVKEPVQPDFAAGDSLDGPQDGRGLQKRERLLVRGRVVVSEPWVGNGARHGEGRGKPTRRCSVTERRGARVRAVAAPHRMPMCAGSN